MMAEFLFTLAEKHDYTQLTDEILREIASKEFKDTTTKEVKDTPNPKTFAAFLVKLSELLPKSVLKNMGLLIGQLDSEVCATFIRIGCNLYSRARTLNFWDIYHYCVLGTVIRDAHGHHRDSRQSDRRARQHGSADPDAKRSD